MNGLGATFAECEFRHSEAYSRLVEVMGYNDEFINLIDVRVIRERSDYLSEALADARSKDRKAYTLSLIMCTSLIEHGSLVIQFAIILSFTRFQVLMKKVSHIIPWPSVDEQFLASAA